MKDIIVPENGKRRRIRRFVIGGLFAMLPLSPMAQSCEEGEDNVPPNIAASTVYHEDVYPQGASKGYWGDPGWIEGEVTCSKSPQAQGWWQTVKGSRVWYAGGVAQLKGNPRYYIQCNWVFPYVVRGSMYVDAWG